MAITFLDLQNGFYNAFSQGLGFAPGSPLQLLQPSTPLLDGPKADPTLWAYFNSIPPYSLTQSYVASGGNQFFSDYRGLLSALSGTPNSFVTDIGQDCYTAWKQYLPTLRPTPATSQLPEVFFSWAMVNFPDAANVGASALAEMILDPISAAQMEMLAYPAHKQPDWTLGLAELKQQLAGAPSRGFKVSTSSLDSNVSKSWTSGSHSGFFGLWSGSSATSKESSQFASNGVELVASFAHVMTFQASPGAWYSSSAMGDAFSHTSGAPWKSKTIDWQNTFGANGNMQRFATSLIVADTMEIQVTSAAAFSKGEQETISKNSSAGLWPFYIQTDASGSKSEVKFDNQGKMTISIKSAPGVPVVLGCNVLPVSQFVGHAVTALNRLRGLLRHAA